MFLSRSMVGRITCSSPYKVDLLVVLVYSVFNINLFPHKILEDFSYASLSEHGGILR